MRWLASRLEALRETLSVAVESKVGMPWTDALRFLRKSFLGVVWERVVGCFVFFAFVGVLVTAWWLFREVVRLVGVVTLPAVLALSCARGQTGVQSDSCATGHSEGVNLLGKSLSLCLLALSLVACAPRFSAVPDESPGKVLAEAMQAAQGEVVEAEATAAACGAVVKAEAASAAAAAADSEREAKEGQAAFLLNECQGVLDGLVQP